MLSTDPIDLKLDPVDGDLFFGDDGNVVFTTGLEAVAQGIDIALSIFKGEYFLDRTFGVAYVENDIVTAQEALLGQVFDEQKARAYAREAVMAVAGVETLRSLAVTFDGVSRRCNITFNVGTAFGDLAGSVGG